MCDDDTNSIWDVFSQQVTPIAKAERERDVSPAATPEQQLQPRPALSKRKQPDMPLQRNANINSHTLRQIKKGKLSPQACLDLHGETQKTAFAKLQRFIERAVSQRLKCVEVVTGKGGRSDTGTGILQAALPDWLNHASIRPFIQSFTYQPPEKGGSGATLILLRTTKNAL